MQTYRAQRPAYINNTHLNVGDTIDLLPRAAQFLLADGTLIAVKSTKQKGANAKKGGKQ